MQFYGFCDLAVLTVPCWYLRQQIEARGLSDIELGPDEQKLRMKSEPELSSSQQQEIEKLRDDLTKKQAELDALKRRVTTLCQHVSISVVGLWRL